LEQLANRSLRLISRGYKMRSTPTAVVGVRSILDATFWTLDHGPPP
jgi:hypothetical protein